MTNLRALLVCVALLVIVSLTTALNSQAPLSPTTPFPDAWKIPNATASLPNVSLPIDVPEGLTEFARVLYVLHALKARAWLVRIHIQQEKMHISDVNHGLEDSWHHVDRLFHMYRNAYAKTQDKNHPYSRDLTTPKTLAKLITEAQEIDFRKTNSWIETHAKDAGRYLWLERTQAALEVQIAKFERRLADTVYRP